MTGGFVSTTVVVVVAAPTEKFGSMTFRTVRFAPRLTVADTCAPAKTGPPFTLQEKRRSAPLVDVLPLPFKVTTAPFGRSHSTVAGTALIIATGGLVTFVPDRPVTVEVAPDSVCEQIAERGRDEYVDVQDAVVAEPTHRLRSAGQRGRLCEATVVAVRADRSQVHPAEAVFVPPFQLTIRSGDEDLGGVAAAAPAGSSPHPSQSRCIVVRSASISTPASLAPTFSV